MYIIILCRGLWEWELHAYQDNDNSHNSIKKVVTPCGYLMEIIYTTFFTKFEDWSSRECFTRFLAKKGVGLNGSSHDGNIRAFQRNGKSEKCNRLRIW